MGKIMITGALFKTFQDHSLQYVRHFNRFLHTMDIFQVISSDIVLLFK
jgi:hypothetical protein